MNKFLIRKDVYNELIEKGYGKKDLSKLTKKQITDKNGHKRTVYVRNGEQPAAQNQPKAQDELTPEKKAKYEDMLKQVMAGSDENALFVRGKGMLNKKDAIAHLSEKLGIKVNNQSKDEFLHGNEPTLGSMMKQQQQKIMKDNDNKVVIKRNYGMISLYGAKTGDHIADFPTEKARLDFMKENNLSKPDENATTPDIKGGEKTIERYKEVNESGNKNTEEYDDKKAFEEYKELVTKDNPTDADHKRIGQLVMEHFNHSKEAWPGGAKLREESGMWEKRYNNLKEGDQVTAYGKEMKIVKKNEYNKTIKAEFVTKDGRKHTTDLSIMDIDDSSFDKDGNAKKSSGESKSSVNGFTLDDIYHHGSDKQWSDVKKIDDMETAKGVVEMIAQKYGATDKGREQLMDFIAYNIGGTNPLYDKLYEEYGVDADDLDMDFEASHDLILNQAMGKDTKKNREQIADSKSDFERRYRQMLEREG